MFLAPAQSLSLRGAITTNKGAFPLSTDHPLARWLRDILACPACRGDLDDSANGFRCTHCGSEFPIRLGIPDFRLAPDPYITVDDELVKIRKLLNPPGKSFRRLLADYYELSPENPPELHQHYIAAMEGSVGRGEALLRRLEASAPDISIGRLLDLGCGTGGLTVAAARAFPEVVGVDVALRWLLIGRQRLAEAFVDAPLICANAEALPFRESAFQAVVGDAVIEHVRDSRKLRDETLRVLKPRGAFFFTTNNRYSILPEPHVRILGFGLLPRRAMERAALRLRKTPYKTRLHSWRELRGLFKRSGRVVLPVYEPGELGERNERVRRIWDAIRRVPPARWMMTPIVPQYFIQGRRSSP